MEKSEELNFWKNNLKGARYILAPMVEQSELPWRLLSRRYGAQLCYSPMLHASVFIKDLRYRKENLVSCDADRPLIIQFCSNDADVFVEAGSLAQDHCEAIDLNLGCPQAIAKRGCYGAFLENNWSLLQTMISRATKELKVPITCKIRIFDDINRTVQYAKMLESAGCKLLSVHGRTKEQKGPLTGLASWAHIKAVKDSVKIPVFANGNIQSLEDVGRCFRETGVDGVMIAEGSLHNPALFYGINPPVWEMAFEYLNLVKIYPCSMSCVRGHLFKICHYCLIMDENKDLRQMFACSKNLTEFWCAVEELKRRYDEGYLLNWETSIKGLLHPPWICQPYIRPQSPCSVESIQHQKRCLAETPTLFVSKKKMKRMMKAGQSTKIKKIFDRCVICQNPKGSKCTYNMCKVCCKAKTSQEILNCFGHKFYYLERYNNSKLQTSKALKIFVSQ